MKFSSGVCLAPISNSTQSLLLTSWNKKKIFILLVLRMTEPTGKQGCNRVSGTHCTWTSGNRSMVSPRKTSDMVLLTGTCLQTDTSLFQQTEFQRGFMILEQRTLWMPASQIWNLGSRLRIVKTFHFQMQKMLLPEKGTFKRIIDQCGCAHKICLHGVVPQTQLWWSEDTETYAGQGQQPK